MIYGKHNEELEIFLENLLSSEFQDFIHAKAEPPAIRINSLKNPINDFKITLQKWNQKFENIGFNSNGITLNSDDLPLSHTLQYFTGKFFYQGVSSQLPVEMLEIKPGDKILDMAAAPGSKSCQILDKLKHRGYLFSNDASYKRMQPLNVNIQRTGACNFVLLNTWGEQFGQRFHEYFDKILLDAPCTATGTLASSNEVVNWWSIAKLNKLTKSQHALLVSGLKALKIGGELVYSTCSVSPEENELVIQKIMENYPVEIVTPPDNLNSYFDSGFHIYNDIRLNNRLKKAIRIFPHKHSCEGFFAIKLKKTASIPSIKSVKNANMKPLLDFNETRVEELLENISDKWGVDKNFWRKYKYNLTKNRIWIVAEINEIPNEKFVSSGLLLAEKKLSGWKLFNNSVTFLNSKVKKRLIELEDEKLLKLFKNSQLENTGIDDGYYVLTRKSKSIASVYVENEKMRIRLPHSFNLVLD